MPNFGKFMPPPPPGNDNTDIWWSKAHNKKINVLICPSDNSWPGKQGLVYGDYWGATNYLANWWYFTNGVVFDGWNARPGNLINVPDGAGNTILLGEAFAWCDSIGRVAFDSRNFHNFGLTTGPQTGTIDIALAPPATYQNGIPNTLMFQVQPQLYPKLSCPTPDASTCCNNWRIQTPHLNMNVALGDGSVRTVAPSISSTTWGHAMTPNDRQPLGPDW